VFLARESDPSQNKEVEARQQEGHGRDIRLSSLAWQLCPGWEEAASQRGVSLSAETPRSWHCRDPAQLPTAPSRRQPALRSRWMDAALLATLPLRLCYQIIMVVIIIVIVIVIIIIIIGITQ